MRAADQIAAVFPAITSVRRSGLFGKGPITSLIVEVPRASDVLRYAVGRSARSIDASVTRIVRGVALKTERCSVAEWMSALVEDLGAYAERERSARDTLTRLFGR